jgi:hypothetical protein
MQFSAQMFIDEEMMHRSSSEALDYAKHSMARQIASELVNHIELERVPSHEDSRGMGRRGQMYRVTVEVYTTAEQRRNARPVQYVEYEPMPLRAVSGGPGGLSFESEWMPSPSPLPLSFTTTTKKATKQIHPFEEQENIRKIQMS